MHPFHDVLRRVVETGILKPTRGTLRSTGEHVDALSVFGATMRFDLAAGFPLITTKFVSFRSIALELLWFLRGDTNVTWLREQGVHIWDAWADERGELGAIYGRQWRRWRGLDGVEVDQIAAILRGLEAVKADPCASVGRRLIVSAWNPADLPERAPPACHTMFQFNVTEGRLSCLLFQRSGDLFLGVPYNIASYALLTHVLAHLTGLAVGELVHVIGDAHVYVNHLEQVAEQLQRAPRALPRLTISPDLTRLEDLALEHLTLDGYDPAPPLRGEVAV